MTLSIDIRCSFGLRNPPSCFRSRCELFGEDRYAKIAGLNALNDAELQHLHDLFDRGAGFEGTLDVTARARRVHVRVGGIERDAEKLDLLRREHVAAVNPDGRRHELVGPYWIEFQEWVPRSIPLSYRFHLVAGGRRDGLLLRWCRARSRGFLKQDGAPRLQEWIDITDAILRIVRISSRVAPTSSAARMCRRVPSGLRFVQAALSATPTNSTNLRGRTPLVQGFVVIFSHAAVQLGSHCFSSSKAWSHGPRSRN